MGSLPPPLPGSPRRRRPSAFVRWLRSFAQWSVVLLAVLVGSSFAAWGIGHFAWVAGGRKGNWIDGQREGMIMRFTLGRGPAKGSFAAAAPPGRRVPPGALPAVPGLSFARVGVGMPEAEFVDGATRNGAEWTIEGAEANGRLLHASEGSSAYMRGMAGDALHPWAAAGPGAVYATDAAGRVTRCAMQCEAPWSGRMSAPLQRMFAAWGAPDAFAWSANDGGGRVVVAWILRDAAGDERQLALVDWRSTPPSFGRQQRAALAIRLFDHPDPVWESRRDTGGLMPTDDLADDVRAQLADADYRATRSLLGFANGTGDLGKKRFAELFGFDRSEIGYWATTIAPPRANPAPGRSGRRVLPQAAPESPFMEAPERPAPTPVR